MLLNLWKTWSCFLGRARSCTSGKVKTHSASQLRRQRHNCLLLLGLLQEIPPLTPKGSTPSSDVTQVLAPASNVRLWPF